MYVNISVDSELENKIKEAVSEKIADVVNKVIGENIDDIIEDTVRKQIKSVALIYIQSPELRNKLLNKVKPMIDGYLEENK